MSLNKATAELERACSSESGISRIGSSGGTLSTLGDVLPKVFNLALATFDIRQHFPSRESCQGIASALAGNSFLFSAIITVIIISA
jgi:hypothetical protein